MLILAACATRRATKRFVYHALHPQAVYPGVFVCPALTLDNIYMVACLQAITI